MNSVTISGDSHIRPSFTPKNPALCYSAPNHPVRIPRSNAEIAPESLFIRACSYSRSVLEPRGRVAAQTASVAIGLMVVLVVAVAGYFVANTFQPPPVASSVTSSTNSSTRYPFSNPGYLTRLGRCAGSYTTNDTVWAMPCSFAGTIEQALVFNCASEGASESGCSAQIWEDNVTNIGAAPAGPSVLNNTITVWNPYVNKTSGEPAWANCMYEMAHHGNGPDFGFCVPLNSTAFAVSGPAVVLPYEGP